MYMWLVQCVAITDTTEEWLGIAHTEATFNGQQCSLGMRLGLQ